jgi:redox-sensitive bicupin YhaK (pirin superfamily)
VVQGSYAGKASPIQLVTDTIIYDVLLQANASIKIATKPMAFVYLMTGVIHIEGKEIEGRSMVSFKEEGDTITIQSGNELAHFIFATGTPHREPIVHGGPFVMTTQAQMRATQERLARGEMGELLS